MPDETLTTAREEIKAILKKHDICAMVMLSSATHINYVIEPQASWNCLLHEEAQGEWHGVRLRCLRKDFATKEAWAEAMRLSVGTVMGFLDCATTLHEQLADLLVMLAKQGVQVEHITKRDR